MAQTTVQAERRNQFVQARQRAHIDAMRLQEVAKVEQAATQAAMVAQERRQFAEQLATGKGVQAGDILRQKGRGLSTALRAQRRLGGDVALGKFEAEEDLAALDAQEADIAMEEARAARIRSSVASASLIAGMAAGGQQEAAKTEGQTALQKEVKKKAKAGFKRGVVFVVDFVAAAFDLGDWVTFLVDWILYLFTFIWLNLQLVYGTYMSKGKSKIISPLDWDPLPINGIVPPLILHMGLITADLILIIVGGLMMGVIVLFAASFVYILSHPVQAATDLATGAGTIGGFSGIIRGLLGL